MIPTQRCLWVFLFLTPCYLPGQLLHSMLPRGLVTDEQLHSEHEIPPDCQPGEENSRNPQEQQVWSKCVFICDVLWLVIPVRMSMPTPPEWERVIRLELVVQGWLETSKKLIQNKRINVSSAWMPRNPRVRHSWATELNETARMTHRSISF